MEIIFVFVCDKNSKFRFHFKCLEDLYIVRVMYFIVEIVSLKSFMVIYIELRILYLVMKNF